MYNCEQAKENWDVYTQYMFYRLMPSERTYIPYSAKLIITQNNTPTHMYVYVLKIFPRMIINNYL